MKKKLRFLFLLIIVLFSIYIYARYVEPNSIEVKKPKISSHYVSNNLENIKIVQFSDTHISEYFTIKDLMKTVKKINKLNPDIVLFTGDLIDNYNTCTVAPKDIAYILTLIDATYGKYSIYGNHDYGGGAKKIYEDIMFESGFNLLINNSIRIEEFNLTITGLDDALFGNPDVDNISNYADENAYNILLCHEPDIIQHIANFNFDLAISGHSHGEQINLPFMDNYILPPLAKKYVRGLYLLNTNRQSKIYVNKGIGTSKIPLRFLAQPEITLFEFFMSN